MNPQSSRQNRMLVSFSGIDGAGKSTQIENLTSYFQQAGLKVKLITFWDDVAALKPLREAVGHKVFKGDKGVGSPEAPIERRDKNVRSPFVTLFRLGIYVVDALSLRMKTRAALRSNAHVIIFDRFIYDELANLHLRSPLARLYVRAVAKLIIRPDVSFILDADPVKARARKPEYPLDFLHENRNAYLSLAEVLGSMTVIPPLPLEQAKAEVVGHCESLLARSSVLALGNQSSSSAEGLVRSK